MTRTDPRHFAAAALIIVTALLASACTGAPDPGGPPSPTASSSSSAPRTGEILAEHDGYIAVEGNCLQMDWAPLQALALFETSPGGYFVQGGNPPQSICQGRFPAGGDPDSTQNNGSANVSQVLQADEESAGVCEGATRNEADQGEPVWDYIGGNIDVSAEEGGLATLNLRAGTLCVTVFLRLDKTLTGKLTDPDTELRSIALALATNARATALRENYPELPAPSGS